MKKTNVKMNKPTVYLGLSILEISKTLMYEFWYDYIKPKYQNCLTWIKTVLSLILNRRFLKKDLTHQIMKSIDHYLQERIKM